MATDPGHRAYTVSCTLSKAVINQDEENTTKRRKLSPLEAIEEFRKTITPRKPKEPDEDIIERDRKRFVSEDWPTRIGKHTYWDNRNATYRTDAGRIGDKQQSIMPTYTLEDAETAESLAVAVRRYGPNRLQHQAEWEAFKKKKSKRLKGFKAERELDRDNRIFNEKGWPSQPGPHTYWLLDHARYQTRLPMYKKNDKEYHDAVVTYNPEDAKKAGDLASVVWMERAQLLDQIRISNREDIEMEYAVKRNADLEQYGNTLLSERECILDHKKRINAKSGDEFEFHIMNDGTHADVLFRSNAMQKKHPFLWLMIQYKTAETYYQQNPNTQQYSFRKISGYKGMLVVMVAKDIDCIWTEYGNILNAHSACGDIGITVFNKAPYAPGGDDRGGFRKHCTNFDGYVSVLREQCTRFMDGTLDPKHMGVTTLEAAERDLGYNHRVELEGIMQYLDCVHGGIIPIDRLTQKQVDAVNGDVFTHRYLVDGKLFRFPIEQSQKTDLIVYDSVKEIFELDSGLKIQFKTVQIEKDKSGFSINFSTASGSGITNSNNYIPGMNHRYVFVLPSTRSVNAISNEFHMWDFSEMVLLERKRIGFVGAPSKMTVHMPSELQKERGGLSGSECKKGKIFEFTIKHHRWWKRNVGGVWTEQ
ncbi:hypothetical protein N9S81_00180 [bacterium]|nr:hypothetical protein [bacterium]